MDKNEPLYIETNLSAKFVVNSEYQTELTPERLEYLKIANDELEAITELLQPVFRQLISHMYTLKCKK